MFRASQVSAEFTFDYALQMSPLLPKQPPTRPETAFSDETVTPVIQQLRQNDFSIETALHQPHMDDHESMIRAWSSQEVTEWMYASGIDYSVIDCFESHDIDGAVLLDLDFDDLKEFDIPSFGKRHQLWSAIGDLRGDQARPSPQPTPFQDTSRPCTSNSRRSPSRNRNVCETPIDDDATPIPPLGGKKRRGRKLPKHLDVITPAESVSIVAIEQLLPKPHTCAKGERCAKWRKQQRELQQLHQENGIGRFPISPTKGGRIFVHGDPGNATTAANMVPPNVIRRPTDEASRPQSEAVPSVVASSDLLGGQLPAFMLHADMLEGMEKRDAHDNVVQFLTFQHMYSPLPIDDDIPPSPPAYTQDPIARSESVPLFPSTHHQAYPSLQRQQSHRLPQQHQQLRHLPRLAIPRSASADPSQRTSNLMSPDPLTAGSICRSTTASPTQIYRLGTPASEVDVPVTAIPIGPVARDASQSVPPNMQFRPQHALNRSHSRAAPDWRRPSMILPAVKEHEILSTSIAPTTRPVSSSRHGSSSSTSTVEKRRDPAHHSPNTQQFGYGADVTQAGWMRKRKTKLLRHEWQDAHCRLKGTELALHSSARLSSTATDTINVDDYAVACSNVASGNKLAAAMRAFNIKSDAPKKNDEAAFAFQLVPQLNQGSKEGKLVKVEGKTHHFAVKTRDERIDWMRELMLAKALQQRGKGYEVEVNGMQA